MKYYPFPKELYEQYKGGIYRIIILTRHTETNEELVIYQSLAFGSIHARPLNMWTDMIGGAPRFRKIKNAE